MRQDQFKYESRTMFPPELVPLITILSLLKPSVLELL